MEPVTKTTATQVNPEPFYATADKFWKTYQRMAQLGPRVKGTPLEAQYAQVMQRGGTIHKTIDTLHYNIKQALASAGTVIQDKYQDAAKWVSGAAQGATQNVKNWFGLNGMDGLGILPLIAVAGISAAVTAMVGWIGSADDIEDQLDAYERLKSQGKTDAEAIAILRNVQPKDSGLLSKFGIPSFEQVGKLALVGVAIYFVGRKFGWWGGKKT